MKVTVKFNYTERMVPPRCRNARDVLFNDGEVTVIIKEVSGEDAPIAIKSTGIQSFSPEEMFQVNYRWYKNKLWTSVKLWHCTPNSYTSHCHDYEHGTPEDVIDLVEFSYHKMIRSLNDSMSKEESIKSIRKSLGNFILIDGVMHKVASEPRYNIITFGLGNNHASTAVFATDRYNPNIRKDWYFNLNERELALKIGNEVAENRGDTKSMPMKVNSGNEFEILIPEAIKIKPRK